MDPQSQQPHNDDLNRSQSSAYSTPQQNAGGTFGHENSAGLNGSEPHVAPSVLLSNQAGSIGRRRFAAGLRLGVATIVLIIFMGLGAFAGLFYLLKPDENANNITPQIAREDYSVVQVPLAGLIKNGQVSIDSGQQLAVNGQLRVNSSFVITPTSEPQNPTTGQIYYSQASNDLLYYDGNSFVSLATNQSISNLGLGAISTLAGTGNGLAVQGQTIVNTGVLSVQGQTGAVTLTSGGGIGINGLTITNTGVTGLAGTANQISVSAASGNVTLALPQNISPASSPTFAGLTLNSPLAVSSGGTGVTAFAANSVIVSNGSGTGLTSAASGSAGQCFTSNGAGVAPTFQACPVGGDDIFVNGSAATNANFINTSATATNAATTWNLATGSNPSEIMLVIGAASAVDAGIVTANAQTLAGAKTFSGAASFTASGIGLSVSNDATIGDALSVSGNTTIFSLSGSGTRSVCADGSNILVSCGANGNGVTLQQAYDADDSSADAIIQLSGAIDSFIVRNPSSNGTDSGYVFKVEQLNTGAVEGLRVESAGTGNLLTIRDTTATAQNVLAIADGGATIFRNQTDSTTAFQIQNAAGASLVNADTTKHQLNVTAYNYDATLGSDLITITDFTNPAWTSTGWTTTTTTATHSTGNTNALSTNQISVLANRTYWIRFTVTGGPTVGETITPNIGGHNWTPISGNQTNYAFFVKTTTTGNLQFIPTSNWNGTISAVSVKLVSETYAPLIVSDGSSINPDLYNFNHQIILSRNAASGAQNPSSGFNIINASDNFGARGTFGATRTRGTTANPTVPLQGDYVVSLLGSVYDGVTIQATAMVTGIVDGPVSAGIAPQRIGIFTSATDAPARVERLTVSSNGNVGIGTTAPDVKFRVDETLTAVSGYNIGSKLVATVTPTSAPAAITDYLGSYTTAKSSSTNVNGNTRLFGGVGSAELLTGSGTTLGKGYGLRGQTLNSSSGTISEAYGLNGLIQNSSTGTISNAYAGYLQNPANTGGGTITNAAGLAIADQTAAANNTDLLIGTSTIPVGNYSLYSASAYSSYFAGNVGIGATSPGEKLEVVGNIISKGTAWTSRTSAADNNWVGVTYGNGLFVAVANTGTGNRVMTSPDGINWTARTTPADNNWRSVTYGNGLFVAIATTGTGNRVMTSPDGINWTSRTSAADNGWHAVTYGNGLFVAVSDTGTGNRVMTSPDGINWTIRASAADIQWSSVTYGNGLFVAVANTGTGNRVMTSPDGINWTSRTSAANNGWESVSYGNGLFVAVSLSGTGNRVMTSPDGINWTLRTSAADNGWRSVTYGNGLFVATSDTGTGNRVMTSPDGINWTLRTSAADNGWISVAYSNGLFVAVGNTGTGNRVMTSGKPELTITPTNNIFQGGTTVHGSSLFKSDADSTTTFQIQNAASAPVLSVDTSNKRVQLGDYSPTATAKVQVNQSSGTQLGAGLVPSTFQVNALGIGDGGGTTNFTSGDFTAIAEGDNSIAQFTAAALNSHNNLTGGTLSNHWGASVALRLLNTGSTTNAVGYGSIAVLSTGSTGSISDYRGFYARTPSIAGTGSITNAYGMYIGLQDTGAQVGTGYGVYQAGVSDINMFSGAITTDQTTYNLINTNATTLNIGGAATAVGGGINLAGGSGSTGCSIDGSTGNLTCSGNITGGSTGTQGYFSRSGTTLQTANAGDNLTIAGILKVGNNTGTNAFNSQLYLNQNYGTIASGSTIAGSSLVVTGNGDATGTGILYGTLNGAVTNGTNSLAQVFGSNSNVSIQNTGGTIGQAYGADAVVANQSSQVVAAALGVHTSITNTGSGSITNAYNLYADSPTVSAGSIDTAYGLLISPQKVSGVTNGIGIYQVGANDLNYFAGNVGLGVVAPTLSKLSFATATNEAGGITFGTAADRANLYRSAPDTLKTDDNFVVGTIGTGGTNLLCYDGSNKLSTCSAAPGAGSYIHNGTVLQTTANFNIQSAGAGSIGGIIRGATSQTADLLQLHTSGGTPLSGFKANGNLYLSDNGTVNITLTSESNGSVDVLQLGEDGSGVLREQHITSADQTGTGSAANLVMNPGQSAGLNQSGAFLVLAGGLSTGNAAGGSIFFNTSNSGASSSDPNSFVNRWGIDGATGHFYPITNNTYDIGFSGFRTRNIYTGKLDLAVTTATTGSLDQNGSRLIHTYGTSNFFAGANSGNVTQTGSGANVGVGANTLAANTTGNNNAALGVNALVSNQAGNLNTAVGSGALGFNLDGAANTGLGGLALFSNSSGNFNTALGYQAGYTSVAGNANTTGSNNTFIGYNAGPGTATQLQNATAIGYAAVVSQDNSLVLGCINGTNGCTASTKVGIGTATPSALLHINALAAGTDTLFKITDNTVTARDVLNIANDGAVTFQNQTNSTAAFQIQDSAGTSNLFVADTQNSRIGIGATPATSRLTIGTDSDTNAAGGITFGTDTNLYRSGPDVLKTDDSFYIASNSTATFQVQKASATDTLLTADTNNNRVVVGNATAVSAADSTLLVVDSATTANLPTGVNGGIIYDTTTGKFKVYEAGSYKTLCNTTDLACGSGSNLQGAYDASTSPATIQLTATDDNIIFQNPASGGTDISGAAVLKIDQLATGNVEGLRVESAGTGNLFTVRDTTATSQDVLTIADGGAATFKNQTDSAAAFRVQNVGGISLLNVDTSTDTLTIGADGGDTMTVNAESVFANTANVSFAPQVVTVSASTATLPTITSSFILLRCNRSSGGQTDLTMSETGARNGQLLTIVVDGVSSNAGTCGFVDSSGVQQVSETGNVAGCVDDFDSISFIYDSTNGTTQWVQTSSSLNNNSGDCAAG